MAISRTATSSSSTTGWSTLGTSFDLAHTCVSGDTKLVVYIFTGGGHGDNVTGVTYNGSAMTLGKKQGRSDNVTFGYVFYIDNPTAGTHNITVSCNPSEDFGMVCGASYTGTTTGSVPEATVGVNVTSTNCTTTLTTITDNDWLVGGFNSANTITVGANTTQIGGFVGTAIMTDTNAAQTPAGSKSMTISDIGSGDRTGVAMTLEPSSGGASIHNLILMGVGV